MVFHSRLSFTDGASATAKIPEAEKICDLIGFNLDDLRQTAENEIKVPKSWAKLDVPQSKEKPKKVIKKKTAKKKKRVKRGSLLKSAKRQK